ncbi:DUF2635 domain-containing protein [Porphyrobacter sp. YT40]|uniref:DUF2635 domain-containing protein n=1 Tax=Porphyrobacter sp. YT40 TaxID=2547601 RepID=UPI001144D873|nr:DUF2635 domain-containing protein [Porphyrobacter sp. YT40]QDH35851.1 DUF2635 domain-containing protein [Porphyrobacter sp. YT40]
MTAALRAERFAPKFGRRVRHPDGKLFDPAGEWIVLNAFYRRLIADGDLVPAPARTPRRPKKGT